jgi:hypothetical protein
MPTVPVRTEQEQVADWLAAGEHTSGIKVICEDDKDLVNGLSIALAKLGLVAVVFEVDGNVTSENLPGPVFDDLLLSVVVYEVPMINRKKTDLTAKKAAKLICQQLHHKRVDGSMLRSKGFKKQDADSQLVYACDFRLK